MDSMQYDELDDRIEEVDSLFGKALGGLLLIEQAGQVLLVAIQWQEMSTWWQLPGGIVDSEDSIPKGLVRKMRDEAGLDVVVDDLLYVMEIEDFVIFTFAGRLLGDDPLSGAKVDCCFIPIQKLNALPMLMGREPLMDWLKLRGGSRRYYRLSNTTLLH